MNRLTAFALFAAMASRVAAATATFGGQTIVPGRQIDAVFPLGKYYQDYAAQGGNSRPTAAHVAIEFPKDFDPSRSWPVLIVTSTSDDRRSNRDDLHFYARAATSEGWVVLASDATIKPRMDTEVWRASLIAAALNEMHREWPGSQNWPVGFAGISGGAKRTGFMAAMLAAASPDMRSVGMFLCGMNDDRLSVAYAQYKPPARFLEIPIWLSSGTRDAIAPPISSEKVESSLKRTGFKHVRLELFEGRHEVKAAEVQRALRWFGSQAGF